jgi:hypothetical protein
MKVQNVLLKISKRKPSFGRYLLRQKNTNKIYGRKVELSMWTELIWLRMFVSDGIFNIQRAEKVANLFHSP